MMALKLSTQPLALLGASSLLLCTLLPFAVGQTATAQSNAAATAGTTATAGTPVPPATEGAATASTPGGATGNVTVGEASLPPFYGLRTCTPFNILVQPLQAGAAPSAGGNGTLTIQADPAVIAATVVSISNGVLAIAVGQGFETNATIQAVITTADATSLRYVQNFGIGDVVVAPGFSPTDFSASATSIGNVYVFGITTPRLRVVTNSAATVAVNGSVTDAELNVGGTSKVYLAGNTTGTVAVQAGGISTTYIQGSATSSITGRADGLAKVLYTDGQCSVQAAFQSVFGINLFGDPCSKVGNAPPAFSPAWTCGIVVNGKSDCSGTSAGEASVPVGAGAPAPAPAPAPMAGAAGAPPRGPETHTITGPGGTVTTSTFTSGPGASATSGGLVGTTGFPPFGLLQQSGGGAPATVAPTPGGTASSASTPPPPSGPTTSTSFASSSGGGTRTSQVDLSIPVGASGLSVVGVDCVDPFPQPMLPAS